MIHTIYGTAGKPITLNGYAQDFGPGVACVQFSCDGGETWTSYPVEHADNDANVNWHFVFTPPVPGSYELLVRSARADGTTTPEPAHVFLAVDEGEVGGEVPTLT